MTLDVAISFNYFASSADNHAATGLGIMRKVTQHGGQNQTRGYRPLKEATWNVLRIEACLKPMGHVIYLWRRNMRGGSW